MRGERNVKTGDEQRPSSAVHEKLPDLAAANEVALGMASTEVTASPGAPPG